MCFVGSAGCIQIFSGTVEHIVPMEKWLNVLDPAFNLHVRTDRIQSAWMVIKPTRTRGRIMSLEMFDTAGALACQLFGARAPGEGEREAWRRLIHDVIGANSPH